MSILRIIPGEQYTLQGAINYISDEKRHDGKIVGYGTALAFRFNPARDMLICKALYGKNGGVEYKQIILSFTEAESEQYPTETFLLAFRDVMEMIVANTGCQVAYAVHTNTDNIHAHYIVNSVQYYTGNKLQLNYQTTRKLKLDINYVLKKYELSPIRLTMAEKETY